LKDELIEMNDLMFMALDHAIESIKDLSPLIPFVITLNTIGEKNLHRFVHEMMEESVAAAKEHINNSKNELNAYAIAWDGFLTVDGQKWDAVLIEAGEAKSEKGALLAQRYEKKGLFKKVNKPVGNPALIEEPTSRVFST